MPKKLKADSLLELTFISDPVFSPQADKVAAVHTRIESGKENDPPSYKQRIFVYDTASASALPFTQASSSSGQPRFSPDGNKLAFVSKRGEDDKPQLYVMPVSGGEAEALTSQSSGVSEFAWHPDGEQIAFVSRGDWQDKDAEKGSAREVERMFYKLDGLGLRPAKTPQLFSVPTSGGNPKRLAKLDSAPSGLQFSSDGEALYFLAARSEKEDDAWTNRIYRLALSTGKLKSLYVQKGRAFSVSPSPDGSKLAFLATSAPPNFGSPTGLWLLDIEAGEVELISGGLSATPSVGGDSRYGAYPNRPIWTEDGKSLVFNVNENGRSHLLRLNLESGRRRSLGAGDSVITAFDYKNGAQAVIRETPSRPGELYLIDGRNRETRLSHVNDGFVEKYRLFEAGEPQTVRAKRGPKVSFWCIEPHKARKDKALVLQVHGGPHTNYGYGFYFEFQLLANQGYTVVYGNPRGSSSYGPEFATTMQGRYGSVDADDVLAIAAAARENHADPAAPIHLTGGSYGGFMTNWLVGHTDMFRSAVTQRSISNWLSFYGTSDIGYNFTPVEAGGNPWDNLTELWDQSPLKYAPEVTTPTLIIHADQDHRCPLEQAEQWFIALKRFGKAPTKLLRFPDEGHELSRSGRPDRRIQRLEAIVNWFEEHA